MMYYAFSFLASSCSNLGSYILAIPERKLSGSRTGLDWSLRSEQTLAIPRWRQDSRRIVGSNLVVTHCATAVDHIV